MKHLVSAEVHLQLEGFVSNDKAVLYWPELIEEKIGMILENIIEPGIYLNYCFAPYDIASWLIQSISANLPLCRLLVQ